MPSNNTTRLSREELIDDVLQHFLELILALKSADMPKWVDLDLTASQMKALVFLTFRGSVTISELARFLRIGNPAASILVQQLVQQELVERSEDAKDRRRTLVRLTKRAAELMSERREQREAKFRHYLSQLTSDELAGLSHGIGPLIEIVRTGQPSSNTDESAE
jgi:DNA-binding MarR family transcriptional regulator